MADRSSPLTFPSPSALLGETARSAPVVVDDDGQQPQSARPTHARRPSKAQKKNPAPRPQPATSDASAAKPKQTKSRNGCVTCKTKRLKCGEEKPGCQNCAKRKVPCGGYKKVFQWRDYGKPDVKATPEHKTSRAATSASPTRQSGESSKSTTPTSELSSLLSGPHQLPPLLATSADAASLVEDAKDTTSTRLRRRRGNSSLLPHQLARHRDSVVTANIEAKPNSASPPHLDEKQDRALSPEPVNVHFSGSSTFAYRTRSLSPAYAQGNTPTLSEILHPDEDFDGFNSLNQQDFVAFSVPEDMQLPLGTSGPVLENSHCFDEGSDTLSMPHYGQRHSTWPSTLGNSPQPDLPGSSQLNFWNTPPPFLPRQPDPLAFWEEYLWNHYDSMTCGILSIFDGRNENPWRILIRPMARSSSALHHALLSLAAFHAAHDFAPLKVIGHMHKDASIRNIGEGIRDTSMTDQTAIATALVLGLSESLEQHTSTGNTHIKGAQALVKRAIESHRVQPVSGPELGRLKFLCNAWVYLDVIARLTSVDSDESNDFDNTFLFSAEEPNVVLGTEGRSKNGFGLRFGMPNDTRLDPLMGCAGTLFPLIGRVANLVKKVCRSQTNSPWIVSHARDIKFALEEWESPDEIEPPRDPTTEVQDALQTAEAYRLATLLHLHQAVPELPSLTSADLAQKILAALASVPTTSRTLVVQIFPLMVAGCEIPESHDRQWVRERWQVMAERMRIGTIEKCLQVTEEVWRRRDAYEAKPLRHRKLVKTAELNLGRRRGIVPRRATEALNSDPGRTGVVFSYIESEGEPLGPSPLKDLNGPESARLKKDVEDRVKVDPAYSVRGHLHWVGVMWDWTWEVLLG